MAILSKNTTIGGSKPHTLASLPVSVVGNELTFKGNKVMLTYSKKLGKEENLNDLNDTKHAGVYIQPLNANATLDKNYPIELSGTLVVLDCIPVVQIYYTYNRSTMYIRGLHQGKFSKWEQSANQSDLSELKKFTESEISKLKKEKWDVQETIGNGKVMKEGAYGLGKVKQVSLSFLFNSPPNGLYFTSDYDPNFLDKTPENKTEAYVIVENDIFYKDYTKLTWTYSTASGSNRTYIIHKTKGVWQKPVKVIVDSDITSSLGTSTTLVASQKLVNDVSTRTTTAQNMADSAYSQANSAMQHANNAMSFSGTRLGISDLRGHNRLIKEKTNIPCFIKKNANTISILKNTNVVLENGKLKSFKENEDVELIGSHIKGSDYAVYIDNNGKLFSIIDNFESPATIPDNCFIIGGYHYGQIPENETLSSGEFATTGNGMIWTQEDVNKIRGINEFSIWDLRFRSGGIIRSPLSSRYNEMSNHGMVYDSNTNRWFAIYHASTEVDKYGISRSGTNIASGTILPIIPSAYNGDGLKKYDNLNWWTANELANSQGSRLLWEYEFNSRAFGVTENKTAGGASVTYPKTERIKGLTSKIGCEQTVGTHYYWGLDTSFRNDGTNWSWKDETKGRGQIYTQGTYGNVKAIFGGVRSAGVGIVGSRVVAWNNYPWNSNWRLGVVATRDSLIL